MQLREVLEAGTVTWTDERVRALWDAAAVSIYRPVEIESVVVAAGLEPSEIPWGPSGRMIWYEAFNVGARFLRLPELIDALAARSPAFRERLAELESAEVAVPRAAADAPTSGDFKNFSADSHQERQIVESMPTLLDVRYLALGVERARSVCRIEARFSPERGSLGTGFRIGPRTILTNHHVVFDEENGDLPATAVQVQFGKELDIAGKPMTPTIINGLPGADLAGERGDDWAVITLEADPPEAAGILSITGPSVPLAVDDRVAIVQHPKGMDKKVGLVHNLVRFVDENVVQYWTDTEEGSSGSPVFNDLWEVVALHHAAVAVGKEDEYGYRNQGRTIERIAARVKEVTG